MLMDTNLEISRKLLQMSETFEFKESKLTQSPKGLK